MAVDQSKSSSEGKEVLQNLRDFKEKYRERSSPEVERPIRRSQELRGLKDGEIKVASVKLSLVVNLS